MSEPTVSVSPPPSASSPVSASSAPPPEVSLLSSLVLLELELLLPPPQPATTSAAIASRSAAKSAAGRILVIKYCLHSGWEDLNIWPDGLPAQASTSNLPQRRGDRCRTAPRNCTAKKYAASGRPVAFTPGQSGVFNLGQRSKVSRAGDRQACWFPVRSASRRDHPEPRHFAVSRHLLLGARPRVGRRCRGARRGVPPGGRRAAAAGAAGAGRARAGRGRGGDRGGGRRGGARPRTGRPDARPPRPRRGAHRCGRGRPRAWPR